MRSADVPLVCHVDIRLCATCGHVGTMHSAEPGIGCLVWVRPREDRRTHWSQMPFCPCKEFQPEE